MLRPPITSHGEPPRSFGSVPEPAPFLCHRVSFLATGLGSGWKWVLG